MSQYAALSNEALDALILELQETRRTRRGEVTKGKLHEMLDPNSPNFMGTGMSVQEFVMAGELQRLANAYWRQTREEKSRRRDAMIALTIEYDKILSQTRHATMWAREAIVEVVNGDWREVKVCRDMLTFNDDYLGDQKAHAPIFARFVEMLDEVLANVPKPEPEVSNEVVTPN